MKVTRCEIDGVLLFDLDAYGDDRGLFLETYQKENGEIEIPSVLQPYLSINKIQSK